MILRRLIVEEPSYDLEYLIEEKNSKENSTLYIKGPYLLAETVNRNGRKYKLSEMLTEVNRYDTEMIKPKRSLGELNHPQSVEINPRDSCHLITELKQDGNTFIGKSKVLSTPYGMLVKSLVMDGVRLGISSRALGKLEKKDNYSEVSGFRMITCDVVSDPSASPCYLDGVLESKQYILQADGVIVEAVDGVYDELNDKLTSLPKHDTNEYLKNVFTSFIESLKSVSK